MENKAVLIVGANGDLGSAVIAELKCAGYTTIGTTRQDKETTADFTIYAPDLCLSSNDKIKYELDQLLSDRELILTTIVEMAGLGWQDNQMTEEKKKEMVTVNVDMPVYWSDAKPDAHHILFSSCAVYGVKGTQGLTFYADTKRNVESVMSQKCKHLTIVRPTLVDTKFAERAGLSDFNTKGFPSAKEVAGIVVKKAVKSDKKLILPGYQAKMLHLFNCVSPQLAQKFLKV